MFMPAAKMNCATSPTLSAIWVLYPETPRESSVKSLKVEHLAIKAAKRARAPESDHQAVAFRDQVAVFAVLGRGGQCTKEFHESAAKA